jgi:flagellar biosynthesis protein FliQ
MMFAYLTGTSEILNHGGNYGNYQMILFSNGSLSSATTTNHGTNFFVVHGWLMWTAWGIFGLLQIISNRYLMNLWRFHIWVHIISGIYILVISLVTGFLAFSKTNWQVNNNSHDVIGIIVMSGVCVIVLLGFLGRWLMNKLRWHTNAALKIKKIHRVSEFTCTLIN